MDADIVREVEFSRGLRGYNVAEVDSFLERMEGMLRRRDLELENLEKKVEELTREKNGQTENIRFLAVSLESTQRELAEAKAALEEKTQEAEDLRQELAAMAQAEALEAEQRCQTAEQSLTVQPRQKNVPNREELQKRLTEVGNVAKDSWKAFSQNIKALKKETR